MISTPGFLLLRFCLCIVSILASSPPIPISSPFLKPAVYAHKETCSEEINIERLIERSWRQVVPSSLEGKSSNPTVKLKLIWGSTMYHIDDLPLRLTCLPDVYTQFRKAVEYKSKIRGCINIPTLLCPAPCVDDWGHVPAISQLGLTKEKVSKGLMFAGGESAALTKVHEYFWNKARLLLGHLFSSA